MSTDRVLIYCPTRKRTFTAELAVTVAGEASLVNWQDVKGKPDEATRWPLFSEVADKPEHYPTEWNAVASKPETATRWPLFTEIDERPDTYPSKWASVSGKPETATRWPTVAEVDGLQEALNLIMQAIENVDIKLREDLAGGYDI